MDPHWLQPDREHRGPPPPPAPGHDQGTVFLLAVRQCCETNADLDPAFYLNADPDPGNQTNADPCRFRFLSEFVFTKS